MAAEAVADQALAHVQSFRTLLANLATLVKNRAVPHGSGPQAAFDMITRPTELQERTFALLGLSPGAM